MPYQRKYTEFPVDEDAEVQEDNVEKVKPPFVPEPTPTPQLRQPDFSSFLITDVVPKPDKKRTHEKFGLQK